MNESGAALKPKDETSGEVEIEVAVWLKLAAGESGKGLDCAETGCQVLGSDWAIVCAPREMSIPGITMKSVIAVL